jgi:hypothetical protein
VAVDVSYTHLSMRFPSVLALAATVLVAPQAAIAADPPEASSCGIELRFTPVPRAQMAIWIEKADGTFLSTVRLTQAVSVRGIGNRPGATQMNSGFRWPYGRREGVLPVWAHRRAAAPGAMPFNRVIFQDRTSEGFASRTSNDPSDESYFCLSFNLSTTTREALDAVTCASAFSSDKGRFIKPGDVARGYGEPMELVPKQGVMRALDLLSPYPPRRDVVRCTTGSNCNDHADVSLFADHALEIMPDLDAVTMATPPGCADPACAIPEQSVLFSLPPQWEGGDYAAFVEVNVEGDYNAAFNGGDTSLPTPQKPDGTWDSWAMTYGYPYRGQPSVVFKVPFTLGVSGAFTTTRPVGYGSVDGTGSDAAELHPMDALITDDSTAAFGSGADRLRLIPPNDYRLKVEVRDPDMSGGAPPAVPTGVMAQPVDDEKHSHQWGTLRFVVPESSRNIAHYEVRYGTREIIPGDVPSFMRALPAVAAKIDTEALMVPVGAAPGSVVEVRFGGMDPLKRYWVGVRAVDSCNVAGPVAVADLTTTRVNFTQLSGCFVATAAYGSALEPEVEALRAVRDAARPRSTLFAAATDLYYRSGPAAAAVVARTDLGRAVVRSLLGPVADTAAAVAPLMPGVPR